MTDQELRSIMEPLMGILKANPQGVGEYELILELEKAGIPEFVRERRSSDLTLFQSHFLLFHILYRLRDLLLSEELYLLNIHCLKIQLTPWVLGGESESPVAADPMRAYYLDTSNLEMVDEEAVQSMLDNFWNRYHSFDRRKSAMETLGLSENDDLDSAKKRYRELAHLHHPDHGGDADDFRIFSEAIAVITEEAGFQGEKK